MQITVESLSKVKKKISLEVPAARVASEIDKVYDEIGKRTAIKGFRKGKVPRALIEKHYSHMMEQDVVKNLINDTYFKAIADEKINPVSYPVIDSEDLKRDEPFRYCAVVEVFPEVEIKEYAGLEVTRETYLFDEEVINRRIEEMRESVAQLKPVEEERPTTNGDYVTLDFEGFVDGVPFEGGKGEDFPLELGSGRFIPGFEEQACGIRAGEEREIRVTFPESYGNAELAGKEATFAIKVKEIKVKELPPLDDDFVKELGEVDTLDQLRAKIAQEYEKHEKERIETEFRERVVKALIEKNDLEIPDAFIDQQLDLMLDNSKKRLAYQRLSLEMMGLDEDRYKVQFRSVAESQVKGSLLLEALARQEGIQVTENDLEEKFRQMSGDNEQSLDAIRKYYLQNDKAKENLMSQLREDKTIAFLIAQAKVTEVPREQIEK
ncbi:MAG: trigger factor [Geobacteraceae bacterium]|nr:trigger factor [Geobacteraceae bacterium]